jgi:hypothetical protein
MQQCERNSLLEHIIAAMTSDQIITTVTLDTIVAFVIPFFALPMSSLM